MESSTYSVLTMQSLYEPKRRATLAGGSRADAIYGMLNQALAVLLLVLFSPVMLVVAACVWLEDGAPVVYAHWRVGQHGRLFRCFKFRSMVMDSDAALAALLARDPAARDEWARHHKLREDPRVLRIGRALRATSLDELPQLFNVIAGDMHLVGPRPVVVQEVRRYGARKHHYLSVKPGMTGLWQVSGRSRLDYEQRVALDVEYVERRSPAFDAVILLRTARVLLTRDGAC